MRSDAMAKRKKSYVLDVAVEFSGVSIGDGTASVGVSIDREVLNIDAADETLCGRRLTGEIAVVPRGVDPDQQAMFDNGQHSVAGTFDTKKFSASPKAITARLTFNLADIEVTELACFAKRSGQLRVEGVEDLAEQEPEETPQAA